jgi:hypothetical protein
MRRNFHLVLTLGYEILSSPSKAAFWLMLPHHKIGDGAVLSSPRTIWLP